ncbi:MAG: sodium:proton antiporter [Ruminococcaceae bacterium]|nr:sodium:proton antiporter [Oscillospiraceae bacterium]
MEMETLLGISIALMAGLFMSRVVKPLKLPAVTGYLIAGILIGPYCLGLLGIKGIGFTDVSEVADLSILNDVALGFIAFAIGDEFRLSQLKHTGKQATIIGIFQAIFTTLVVDVALIGLHFILGEDKLPLSSAIILGAIASATAPAATLMVVRQYKAKGKLTNLLLPIVALDDAVGLIIFAVSFGIAKALTLGEFSLVSVLVDPIAEIVFSLALGAVLGWCLSFAEKFFHSRSKRQAIVVTAIFLAVALSKLKFHIGPVHIGFSPLLVCMMLGTVFCNVCEFSANLMEKTDRWTAPLFILFFVLSGAELEFSVFTDLSIIGIGIIYIITRSLGKYFGARWSSVIAKSEPNIQKYLGITLLPQAGVALGMSITAMEIGESGVIIRNIVLFGVLIYELFGPTLTKIALTRAGDISPKPHKEKVALPKGRDVV